MRNILIALFAIVLVASLASAQLASVAATDVYTADVISTLALSQVTSGNITSLSPGYTYTLNPDPALTGAAGSVTPVINGAENGTAQQFELDADPGEAVQLTYALPSLLVGTGASGLGSVIPCSFNATSLLISETGQIFNPNVPVTVLGISGGVMTMNLGITVTVPPTAAPDTYTGTITATAAVTGF